LSGWKSEKFARIVRILLEKVGGRQKSEKFPGKVRIYLEKWQKVSSLSQK
jgi:hypothetical protein